MQDAGNELLLSAASSWEIAVKYALGKLPLPVPPLEYVPSRMAATRVVGLAVEHAHALQVSVLAAHHRDPFDRLLVAQAIVERIPILTADAQLAAYDVEREPPASPRTAAVADEHLVDLDLRLQRARDRAAVGDVEEALALLGRQRAVQRDLDAEAMDEAGLGDAVGAVLGVLAVVRDADVDAFERKLLALGVELQRHRRAAAERRRQRVVGRRSLAGAADVHWLVEHQSVRPGLDFGAKATPRRRRRLRCPCALL